MCARYHTSDKEFLIRELEGHLFSAHCLYNDAEDGSESLAALLYIINVCHRLYEVEFEGK